MCQTVMAGVDGALFGGCATPVSVRLKQVRRRFRGHWLSAMCPALEGLQAVNAAPANHLFCLGVVQRARVELYKGAYLHRLLMLRESDLKRRRCLGTAHQGPAEKQRPEGVPSVPGKSRPLTLADCFHPLR